MEVVGTSSIIPITAADLSQVGQARRRAVSLAHSIGFGESRLGELSIVVTEAARNIAIHANEGIVSLTPWVIGDKAGLDVIAMDRGLGIDDIDRAIEDGYSTAGTAGEGLGALSRIAATLQIYSTPQVGTLLFARVLREAKSAENGPESADSMNLSVISAPIAGESVCGDGWMAKVDMRRSIYLMADGLGHGPFAHEAAQEAVRVFNDTADRQPEFILREIHRALAKTRGAAVSVAEILHGENTLNYAGVGNISSVVYCGSKTKSLVSMNGTAGHSVAKFQQFSHPWEKNSILIMHSDGLGTRWNLDAYPGLGSRHPALIAGLLYRDFARGRDDASILVTRK